MNDNMKDKPNFRGGLERELQYRDPNTLTPHPDNPRGDIDPSSPEVIQLADDIARRGLIQPIVITPEGVVLAGHRRRTASIVAGLMSVPVVIRELAKHEFAEEFFISENMQRQDLSPLEEARVIAALRKKLEAAWGRKATVADLARRVDMPKNTITLRLYILQLPKRIQNLFHILEIPLNSSRQLARLVKWPDEVERFADRLVTRQISLNSLEALVTRRLVDLNDTNEPDESPIERPDRGRQYHHTTESSAPVVTRDVAVANLSKRLGSSISMFNIKAVLDSVCCSCGMIGNSNVCISCPLPKFVNGLVGRANGNGNSFEDE